MWKERRRQRWQGVLWLMVFCAILPTLLEPAQPAVAAATMAPAAPSADPDEELVYIDADGVIRVLDTRVTGANPEVKWFSPTGGWRDAVLGDVNNDGDMEIIAIGGGATDGRLAVFDPVVASGVIKPDQKINGIPWDTLYETQLPGSPQLVAAGNFDDNLPGDEIMYFYDLVNNEDRMRVVVLKPTTPTPDGRTWQEHVSRDFGQRWEAVSVGDWDEESTDEFAVVSEDDRNMSVWRIGNGIERIDELEYGSDANPPKAVAFGEWEEGDNAELAWVRGTDDPRRASAFVWQYEDDGEDPKEPYAEAFDPSPRFLFWANINDNDHDELIMLRNVPDNRNSPRMIVRGRNQRDIPAELEARLDNDNGYRAGAGGDIDGDGRDEIVLIRDNRILIFFEAERSNRTNSFNVTTNRRTIRIGDLDKNGFISGPQFAVDRSRIDATVEAGGGSKTEFVTLINTTSSEQIPFNITVANNPPWLSVAPTVGLTPAQLLFTFNGSGIQAGDYSTQVSILSTNPAVVNDPLIIEVNLKVTAAVVALQPAVLAFNYPCTTTTTITSTPSSTITIPTQQLTVNGTPGVRFTAAILRAPELAAATASLGSPVYNAYVGEEGLVLRNDQGDEATIPLADGEVSASAANADWPSGVPWLSASSPTGVIPDIITLQARPLTSTLKFDEAVVVVVADSRAGAPPGNMRLGEVSIVCASGYSFLSQIKR